MIERAGAMPRAGGGAASATRTKKASGRSARRRRSLRDWRESLGLRQSEVAEWMGVGQVWVSRTECGAADRPKQAERLRSSLLSFAKARRDRARIARCRIAVTRQARQAWAQLREPDRGRFTAAMSDLVWEYLDSGQAEEADVIGLLMPGETYRQLLDAFFDETVERAPLDGRAGGG